MHETIVDDTYYVCSPLGYNMEWNTADVYREIERKLVVLEV